MICTIFSKFQHFDTFSIIYYIPNEQIMSISILFYSTETGLLTFITYAVAINITPKVKATIICPASVWDAPFGDVRLCKNSLYIASKYDIIALDKLCESWDAK